MMLQKNAQGFMDGKSPSKMLERLSKNTEIIDAIKVRKLEYFGHVMRGQRYRTLQNIMQGKIEGRMRISWLRNLRIW